MSPRATNHRWVPALAIAAVSIAALGTVTVGTRENAPARVDRPAADAPVHVVRAPASAQPQHQPACTTCAMGAGRSAL